MLVQRVPPENHKEVAGSLYCADPDCKYCKDLREAQEQLNKGEAISKNRGAA
jgi:hypothetical protein